MVSGDSLAFSELDHLSLNSFLSAHRWPLNSSAEDTRLVGRPIPRQVGTEIGENTDSLRRGTEGRCEIWRFAERKSVSQGSLGEMQAKSGSLYRKRHANSRCAWLPRKVSGPQRESSAVFGTVLVRRNGSKRRMCSQRSPGGGKGCRMLDPTCGRVRPMNRKQTNDFGFS